MKRELLSVAIGAAASLLVASSAVAGTLDDVKKKGFLQCGVSQGLIGFSNPDEQNNWTGLDVDFCRAVASAIFNDPQKVKFTPLSAKERFTALQSGEIDILSRNTTWTMSRDTSLGLKFAGVMYYDGQGFMVNRRRSREDGRRRQIGAQAQRRHGMHPDRHHHRTQPRRLFPLEQHDLPGRGLREERGSAEGL